MAKQTVKKPVPATLRIPITNIFCSSDYTATLFVGSEKTPANVIMDTGSSTLAVKPSTYHAAKDNDMTTTTLAQEVLYGTGGWAGPVVNTSLVMGTEKGSVRLEHAPIAITSVQQPGNFEKDVDGIMGLAYNALNGAYDFKSYIAKNKIDPAATFPWIFPAKSFKTFSKQFQKVVSSQRIPEENVVPYFTELETKGIVSDKFAFYTLRSWIRLKTTNAKKIASDPYNNGWFILGGGEEEKDLYTGGFVNVAVMHDLYYNTNLRAVQVAGCEPVAALPLQRKYRPYAISNSIVDSGTSDLSLSQDVYDAIINSFQKLDPWFVKLINRSNQLNQKNKAIATSSLKLEKWPDIIFILAGENGEDVKLTCTPDTYWQTDFPAGGQAMFQISGPIEEGLNQSILGLPLMNNYYCVFDRSLDSYGIIRFAKIKKP
jgi:hypothetical protein